MTIPQWEVAFLARQYLADRRLYVKMDGVGVWVASLAEALDMSEHKLIGAILDLHAKPLPLATDDPRLWAPVGITVDQITLVVAPHPDDPGETPILVACGDGDLIDLE